MNLGKRIMVMGSSGSGKSTVAALLGEITGLPVVHLDRLTFNPGWETAPDAKLRIYAAADTPEWVIDGNYSSTRNYRLERADTVIFLDFNRYICLFRAVKRRIKYHDKTRPDMGVDCPEKLDPAFIKWIWDYPRRSRGPTLEWLKKVEPPKQVIYLKGNSAVRRFLEAAGETT